MATRRKAAAKTEDVQVSQATGHVTNVSGSSVSCAGCAWTFEAPADLDTSMDGPRLAKWSAAVHEGRSRRTASD